MTHPLLITVKDNVQWICFNRVEKHNAFDDVFLHALHQAIMDGENNPHVRVIVLKANGQHFSAGGDLAWMKKMVHFSEAENKADADILAQTLLALYNCVKPTIAIVQGAAYGGGAGLVAVCDIAIASDDATLCFSEVKLGLIPAVISPYVIRAVGERVATWLFMTAEILDAPAAKALHLVHHCIPRDALHDYSTAFVSRLTKLPPGALLETKALVRRVAPHPIDNALSDLTATWLAKRRVTDEAQQGLHAFLNRK